MGIPLGLRKPTLDWMPTLLEPDPREKVSKRRLGYMLQTDERRHKGIPVSSSAKRDTGSVRRRIEFDTETFHALTQLARDRMSSIQELADEAFRDLLKKHRRPTTLKEMLRESVRSQAANDHPSQRRRRRS